MKHQVIFTILLLFIVNYSLVNGQNAKIKHFQIVRTSNGKFVRRLRKNDVLTFGFAFTVIAQTSGPVSSVTFTQPRANTITKFPYALQGITRFTQGQHRISAYVNDDSKNPFEVSFTVRYPGFPIKGPLPDELTPINDEETNFTPITVYPISGLCSDDYEGPPTVTNYRIDPGFDCNPGKLPGAFYSAFVCSPLDARRLRVRRVELFKKNGKLQSFVKPNLLLRDTFFETSVSIYDPQGTFSCPQGPIFYEVCDVLDSGRCGTSVLESYNPDVLIPPSFLKPPPAELKLSRGDSTSIKLRNIQSNLDLGNCRSDPRYSFQLIIQSRNGRILKRSRNFKGRSISIFINNVNQNYDGALVFLEYSYVSCSQVKAVSTYTTRIFVDKSN